MISARPTYRASALGVFDEMTQTNADPYRDDVKEAIRLFVDGKLAPDHRVHLVVDLAGDAARRRAGRAVRQDLEETFIRYGAYDSEFTGHVRWTLSIYAGRLLDIAKLPYIGHVSLRSAKHLEHLRQAAQYNVNRGLIPAPPAKVQTGFGAAQDAMEAKRAAAGVSPGTWKEFRGRELPPADPVEELRAYVGTRREGYASGPPAAAASFGGAGVWIGAAAALGVGVFAALRL